MTLSKLLIFHVFAAGIAGIFVQWHIAAWKLSTESIDSPRLLIRWAYRYLVFSFWYMMSFLVTPAMAAPLLEIPSASSLIRAHQILFFLINLPLAALLYFFDRRIKIRFDETKIKAREKLRKKIATRHGR